MREQEQQTQYLEGPNKGLDLEPTEAEAQLSGLDYPKLLKEFENFGFHHELGDFRSEIHKLLPKFIEALRQNRFIPPYLEALSSGDLAVVIQLEESGADKDIPELLSRVERIKTQMLPIAAESFNSSDWIKEVAPALDQLSVVDELTLITYMQILRFENLNKLLAEWFAGKDGDDSAIRYRLKNSVPSTK